MKEKILNYKLALPDGRVTTPALLLDSLKTFYSGEEQNKAYELVASRLYYKNDNIWVSREDGSSISIIDLYIKTRTHYRKSMAVRIGNTIELLWHELHGTSHMKARTDKSFKPFKNTLTSELPDLDRLDKLCS